MIIHISKEEESLLSGIAKRHEWDLEHVALENETVGSYLARRIQISAQPDFIVIDEDLLKEEEIPEVVESVNVFWSDVVILLLVNELRNEESESIHIFYSGKNLIRVNRSKDDLQNTLERLLCGEKLVDSQSCPGTWIGIMSAGSGAGATDFAMGLSCFIKSLDENVCYVEANESGDLQAMADFYGFEKIEENHYRKDGLDYWHQSIDPEQKYVVLDLGKFSRNKERLFAQCKVKVLVSDGKPYRMMDTYNILKSFGLPDIMLCLNFCREEELLQLKQRYLESLENDILLINRHESLFDKTDPVYQTVMRDYMEPADKKKFFFHRKKRKEEVRKTEKSVNEQEETVPDKEVAEDLQSDPGMEEMVYEEPYVVMDNPKKKNHLVSLLGAGFLLVATVAFLKSVDLSGIRDYVSDSFSVSDEKTPEELVDEDLNIDKNIKITVLEVDDADGYEVSYSTDQNFDQKTTVVVEVDSANKAVENLDEGMVYYVRVRAFKYTESGTKMYGEYTDVQKIRT